MEKHWSKNLFREKISLKNININTKKYLGNLKSVNTVYTIAFSQRNFKSLLQIHIFNYLQKKHIHDHYPLEVERFALSSTFSHN